MNRTTFPVFSRYKIVDSIRASGPETRKPGGPISAGPSNDSVLELKPNFVFLALPEICLSFSCDLEYTDIYQMLQLKTIRDAYRISRRSPQASCVKYPIWAWFRKLDAKGEINLAVFLENWFDRS